MIVVDASAIVAILVGEEDGQALARKLDGARAARTKLFASTVTVWEASLAVARLRFVSRPVALDEVEGFLRPATISQVAPDQDITTLAVQAAERYGLGAGYPGILNLGDCFSYATARHLGASLLFKGDDFTKTDITPA